MKKLVRSAVLIAVSVVTVWLLLEPSAWAVPSYSRRYGVECSTCHTMWGSLNAGGLTFRLSGYRAIFGKPMKPETEDIEISKGVTIPSTLPLSFITGVGYDNRKETRDSGSSPSVDSTGSSLALEDASIFMTSPLGEHLSAFVEFPMFETRAWEFTPTGNFEARYNTNPGRQIQFATESPTFEVAKFFWNNLFGDAVPRDSVNLLAGITQLPMGYPTGKVRLAVNQYLVYERTALDLISPRKVDSVFGGDPNDFLFRLSEAQTVAEVNGMLAFGKPVTDTSKRDTFWAEYHLGVSNGSNAKADNNTQKDTYGRFVMRWYNQSLGFFGYRSGDIYSDNLRTTASTGVNDPAGTGIMSGAQDPNKVDRYGPDLTLSLVPFSIPVWLENAVMYNKESNPTGFGQQFKWKGGLDQLNWQISKVSITYLRYDWIKGDPFDDTTSTVNGVTGITRSTPKEHDWIIGYQHLYEQNIKLIAEYRQHVFEDTASGGVIPTLGVATNPAKLSDKGFTLRAMFGF